MEDALKGLSYEVIYNAPLKRNHTNLDFIGYDSLDPTANIYFQVDDDLSYPGPINYHPSVYWCIDTHRLNNMSGGWSRFKKMEGFDYVFAAQKDGSKKLNIP